MPGRSYVVSIPIKAANLVTSAANAVVKDLDKIQKKIGGIEGAQKKLQAAGDKLKSVGTSMSFAGAAIVAPLGFAAKKAADFEEGLAKVATMMDGPATAALDKFGADIRSLSKETGVSTAELNEALYNSISAGVDQGEAMAFLTKSTKAAVGGFADVSTVVDGATAVINGYGMKTSEVLKITDQLQIANDVGKTNLQKLSASVGDAAATAAQFGVSTGEMLAAIGTVTKVTGNTEEAFTGLKAVLNAIASPSLNATEALEDLNKGLAGKDQLIFSIEAMQKMGLQKWFERFQKVTKGSSVAVQKLIGDERRAATFIRTLDAQSKTFNDTVEKMNKATGAGAKSLDLYAKAQEGNAQKMKIMKARLADMVLTVGNEALPAFVSLGQSLTPFLTKLAGGVSKHKEAFAGLVKTLVFVGAALVGAGSLNFALGTILKTLASLSKVISGLRVALLALAGGVGAPILAIGGTAAFVGKMIFDRQKLANKMEANKGEDLRAANQRALEEAALKAKGINPATFEAGLLPGAGPTLMSGITIPAVGAEIKSVQAAKKASDAKAAEIKKANKKTVDEEADFWARMAKEAEKGSKKTVEVIDIFSSERQRNLLESNGFATDAIQGAVGQKKTESKTFQIGSINLPNVGDREDLAIELEKLSLGFGVG